MYSELQRAFSDERWHVGRSDEEVVIVPKIGTRTVRADDSSATWDSLIAAYSSRFAELGYARSLLMPLSYSRGSEVLNSAVQGLDPYLKDGHDYCFREGVLTQPVVRFGAAESSLKALEQGFLTSFVNLSRVGPVASFAEYARAACEGTELLLGMLGGNDDVFLSGATAGWRREHVQGFTLRIYVGEVELGDFVFIESRNHPQRKGFDMGASLERLRWTVTGIGWADSVFGEMASARSPSALDALRTSILLVGCGIDASARGAGSVTRRAVQRASYFGIKEVSREDIDSLREIWDAAGIWMRPTHDIEARLTRELSAKVS